MTTISQVAKHAKTSIGTVSRVLNNKKNVSPEAKQRVLKAIAELNYTPTVASNRYQFVVVTYQLRPKQEGNDTYFVTLLTQLLYQLNTHFRHVQILSLEQLDQLDPRHVSTVIHISQSQEADEQIQQQLGQIPLIHINGHRTPDHGYNITSNHYQSAFLAMRYLHQMGHEHVHYINFDVTAPLQQQRMQGLCDAAEQLGMTCHLGLLNEKKTIFESVLDAVNNPSTCVFMGNGSMLMNTYFALLKLGIRIGEDLSFISIDAGQQTASCHPPLTVVREPLKDMIDKTVELTGKIIAGEHHNDNRQLDFNCELIVRSSVKSLR
ncbi:MAG: LacI family DNA-binding transcriptional regulator [Phycisphaeraceae bacterium JB051]